MSDHTIPRTEVTVELAVAAEVARVSVSNSIRDDLTEIRVTYKPERDLGVAGIQVPEYVTLNVGGDASVSLSPATWVTVVDALTQVLSQVPSLNGKAAVWTPEDYAQTVLDAAREQPVIATAALSEHRG